MSEVQAAAAKRQSVCSKSFEEQDDGTVTGLVEFEFSNGVTHAISVFDDFSEAIQRRLTIAGVLHTLGDSYAGAKGSAAEAIRRFSDRLEALKSGSWRVEGEAKPRLGELIRAIARIKLGNDSEESFKRVEAVVTTATDDQRKQWRSNAKVKAVIAQIRAEEAARALQDAAEEQLEVTL